MPLTQSLRRLLVQPLMRRELQQTFKDQRFCRTNERPVEYSFAFRYLNDLQPQTVLDVGTGRSASPGLLRKSGSCGQIMRPPRQSATPSHLGCFVMTKDLPKENRQ